MWVEVPVILFSDRVSSDDSSEMLANEQVLVDPVA